MSRSQLEKENQEIDCETKALEGEVMETKLKLLQISDCEIVIPCSSCCINPRQFNESG